MFTVRDDTGGETQAFTEAEVNAGAVDDFLDGDGRLNEWNDQIASNDGAQAVAFSKAYWDNAGINSKPAWDFRNGQFVETPSMAFTDVGTFVCVAQSGLDNRGTMGFGGFNAADTGVSMMFRSTGALRINISNGVALQTVDLPGAYSADTPACCAVSWDIPNTRVKLRAGTVTPVESTSITSDPTSTESMTIGSLSNSASSAFFGGFIVEAGFIDGVYLGDDDWGKIIANCATEFGT